MVLEIEKVRVCDGEDKSGHEAQVRLLGHCLLALGCRVGAELILCTRPVGRDHLEPARLLQLGLGLRDEMPGERDLVRALVLIRRDEGARGALHHWRGSVARAAAACSSRLAVLGSVDRRKCADMRCVLGLTGTSPKNVTGYAHAYVL